MGSKWVHRISQVDAESGTGVCEHCGPVEVMRVVEKTRNNYVRWRCGVADKQRRRVYNKGSNWYRYRRHVKDKCERCGFVPEQLCQLEVLTKMGSAKTTA